MTQKTRHLKHKPHHKSPTSMLVFLNSSGRSAVFKHVLHLTRVAYVRNMGSSPRRPSGLWLKNLKHVQDNFTMLQTKCPFQARGRTLSAFDSSGYVSSAAGSRGRQTMNPIGCGSNFLFPKNFAVLNWNN